MTLDLKPGTVLAGRYRVDRELGRGGMGVVWAATHTITRKLVALKVLSTGSTSNPQLRRRFLREARAASVVAHPNIVQVHDVLELDDGELVMVMELLAGENLEQKLEREHRLSLQETARIVLPVISAVGTVHASGIIHRDLKPGNVFLVKGGNAGVKVLDFGIAKVAPSKDGEPSVVTGTGDVVGTPLYMAPEHILYEKDLDYRIDVWALGVILFECLSGRRPLEGDNLAQIIRTLLADGPARIERHAPDLPQDLRDLLRRMLARERDERLSDLHEAVEVLRRYDDVAIPDFGAPATQPPPESDLEVAAASTLVVVDSKADGGATTAKPDRPSDTASPSASPVQDRERRGHPLTTPAGLSLAAGLVLLVFWLAWPRKSPAESGSGLPSETDSIPSGTPRPTGAVSVTSPSTASRSTTEALTASAEPVVTAAPSGTATASESPTSRPSATPKYVGIAPTASGVPPSPHGSGTSAPVAPTPPGPTAGASAGQVGTAKGKDRGPLEDRK